MTEKTDDRPRIYMHSSTQDQTTEVTVKGATGESSGDIEQRAVDLFDHAKDENAEQDEEDLREYA